jgi:multisubunit Na+/H+ antiporter MnhG subunit
VAGGVSGAASGGILGLVLALLAQQFGYIDFSVLLNAIILLFLVILVFAVVFGLLGRAMKGRALRRAKLSAPSSATDTPAPVEPEAEDSETPPAP